MKKRRIPAVAVALSIILSMLPFSAFAETTEETVYTASLNSHNYGYIQAEDATVDINAAEIAETESAFAGKSVFVKEPGIAAVKMNFVPRMTGNSIIWLRYSAKDKSSNALNITIGDKKDVFYELPVTGENKYNWIKVGSFPTGISVAFEFSVSAIEKGMYIDAVVHTAETLWRPANNEESFNEEMTTIPQPMHGLPMPEVFPRKGHPRVMFTKDDIPAIKANLTHPENAAMYSKYQELLNYEGDGVLPSVTTGTNRNDTLTMAIEALAFSYAIEGNEEHGLRAVSLAKNMLSSFYMAEGLIYHNGTTNIWIAAIIYDWCFPLLTDEDKLFLRYYSERIDEMMLYPYPWDVMNEGGVGPSQFTVTRPFRDHLAFAIASYDEYPDWYNYLASLLINEYAPLQDYYLPGESMPSGSSYGHVRWYVFGWSRALMEVACGINPYTTDYTKVMLEWIYEDTPEGQYLRSGDDTISSLSGSNLEKGSSAYTASYMLAMRHTDNPYLKSIFKHYAQVKNPNFNGYVGYYYTFTPVQGLLLNDPEIEARSYDNLPLTHYFGSPTGKMVARTGWDKGIDTENVMAYMYIGEERPINHGHYDSGSFQLYYKGLLMPDLGHYSETGNAQYTYHNKSTLSHNALLIKDPNESGVGNYNFGGQRTIADQQNSLDKFLANFDRYKLGDVTGHEFGPDTFEPEYSYISGNITKAYSDKVDEVSRYMMFMPTDDEETPAVMMVFDKIDSANPSFKKTMLLQAYEEPSVEGNAITFSRSTAGFTGAAVNQILYPQNPVINPIGGVGKQWYLDGDNLNPKSVAADSLDYGWGRVEVSPSEEKEVDYFLNAIYVYDTLNNTELQKAEVIETEELLGARLLNKVVMFPKDTERTDKALSFEIPGEGNTDVAVTGIKAGTWKVTVNGSDAGDYYATEEGGMIYFKTAPGKVTLTYASSEVKDTFTSNENELNYETSKFPDIIFKVNNIRMYAETPLEIRNSTCYIPFETLYKNLNAEIEYSNDGKTATATRSGTTISYTLGDAQINCLNLSRDASWENDIPIWEKNGQMMVPLRSSAKAFGGTVTWNEYPRTVDVSINTESQKSDIPGLVPIIGAYCTTTAEVSAYVSFDNDPTTIWTASGDGAWMVWELPYEADIKAFVYDSNRTISDERQYIFDLYYSLDGVEFTHLYSGMSNVGGAPLVVNLPSGVKAKYLRYVGHTNTKPTTWNNVAEFQFYEAKVDPGKVK